MQTLSNLNHCITTSGRYTRYIKARSQRKPTPGKTGARLSSPHSLTPCHRRLFILEADRASQKKISFKILKKRLISSSTSSQAQSLPNDACLSLEKYKYSFVCLKPGVSNNKPIRTFSSLTQQLYILNIFFIPLRFSIDKEQFHLAVWNKL